MTFMMKKKKYKFQVDFQVDELSSVTLVNALLFAKIRLMDGGNYTNTSSKEEVCKHCVKWKAKFNFVCKMSANANTGLLDPCICRVSIRKESKGGRSFQKLGFADINLAEFAGCGSTFRSYLLEGYDAKHRQDNSTLRVTIVMSLLSGDPCFKVPTTRPISLPGEDEQLLSELRREEHLGGGGGSLTSGSSGIGSLPRKQRINVLTSDLVSSNTTDQLNEVAPASSCVGGSEEFEMTHSRNSSCTSQQSKASGYSSMHSRQSSSESGQQVSNQATNPEVLPIKWDPNGPGRNSNLAVGRSPLGCKRDFRKHSRHSSLDFVPGHRRNISSSSSDAMSKATERKRKQILEDPKESRMDSTRVSATDLINELVQLANLGSNDATEPVGLCLYVLKDGTATLGSHEMQSRVKPGTLESVVFENK